MADTAAWLEGRVLPDVPVRQWVVTFPWKLRFELAYDPELCRAVRRTFLNRLSASSSVVCAGPDELERAVRKPPTR